MLCEDSEKDLIDLIGPVRRNKPEEFKNLGFLTKIGFVMRKKSSIVKLVGKMKDQVDNLDQTANRYWEQECEN